MRPRVPKKSLLVLSCYSILLSVGMHPTGRISVKFNSGDFYEKLSRNSRLGHNQSNISGILYEHVSTFYCSRLHKSVIRALLCNTLYFILCALKHS